MCKRIWVINVELHLKVLLQYSQTSGLLLTGSSCNFFSGFLTRPQIPGLLIFYTDRFHSSCSFSRWSKLNLLSQNLHLNDFKLSVWLWQWASSSASVSNVDEHLSHPNWPFAGFAGGWILVYRVCLRWGLHWLFPGDRQTFWQIWEISLQKTWFYHQSVALSFIFMLLQERITWKHFATEVAL